uniref:DBH-like monooxygenase protein 1 n=1 Tax=Myxine glutinosa TaxID=7769 RepID=UPI00358E70E6
MLILKFFLLLILLLQEKQCSATSDISTTEFKHVAQLHDKYRLQWNFNSTHIIFRAQAQTQGYMSFGLSIKGGMYDSDIFVCTHRNTCTDRYSMETVMPKVDDSQDYHLFNDSTNGTHRTIIFGRKLQTGDNKDLDITPDTSRVIFAFGDTKNLLCHGHTNENRGTKSLYLLAYVPRESTVPDNVKTEDLLSQKYKIPGESTVYSCTMFMLPNISTKHHLVKVEPVIQQGNERYVHHMILYSCRRGTKELHRTEHRCYNKNMPDDFWSCVGIIVAWAVGGQSFVYPKDVGFSLGMPDDPTIVLLEIHYDNPGRKTDGVDSSGFKLFYTPELRLIDSGILEVGADPSRLQIIPPRAASFRVYGICPTQNFGDGEQDVIYAFASLLHSHLAGTAMRLRKISGNGSISLVTEDKAYDFNFQENRFFPKPIPIRKGETLLIDCIYNTETRSNVTTGGFHTEEEMCIAYLHYYPRITLARCRSNYDATELMSDFLSANMKSKSCVVMPNTTNVCRKYLTVMSQVDWKKDTIETFQEITSRVSYEVKQYMTVTGQWQYSATKLPDFVQQEVHQRKTSSKNSKSEGAVCVLPSWWAMIVFLIVSIIMQK